MPQITPIDKRTMGIQLIAISKIVFIFIFFSPFSYLQIDYNIEVKSCQQFWENYFFILFFIFFLTKCVPHDILEFRLGACVAEPTIIPCHLEFVKANFKNFQNKKGGIMPPFKFGFLDRGRFNPPLF